MEHQELEVKFYVQDLEGVQRRLEALGAHRVQPRTLETNLRFDTPGGDLTRAFRALRLRQDSAARLTYKGPAEVREGVRVRPEIEFVVSDFGAAREFLQALGYQVSLIYEKYRATYDLGEVHVTLDELPYGNFVEIEGPDPASILAVNTSLNLDWEARLPDSYTVLFSKVRSRLGLRFRDLIFENFEGLQVQAEDLDARPADLQKPGF
ncbi:MAG: class IV adenylate cyclase [Chloroflexota bacterium]